MKTKVLKFGKLIPFTKIVNPDFFLVKSYLPFGSYARWKKSGKKMLAGYLKKHFEL